jgi:hypothetical protein
MSAPHLGTETDPVSETLCSPVSEDHTMHKVQHPVILSDRNHNECYRKAKYNESIAKLFP